MIQWMVELIYQMVVMELHVTHKMVLEVSYHQIKCQIMKNQKRKEINYE